MLLTNPSPQSAHFHLLCLAPQTPSRFFPAGPFVVWQDNRNGDWDIYGYDLDKKTEYAICTADGNQTNPCVGWGSILDDIIVAWQDDRNGNSDIYGFRLYDYSHGYYFELGLGEEIAICTNPAEQTNPVSGMGHVFWQDNRNGDWDIYASRHYPLDTDEPNETVICGLPDDQINPAVWLLEHTVVWQDNRNGSWDIYGFDMEDQNELPVSTANGNQTNPASSFFGVAWQDDRNGNDDIYAAICENIGLCENLVEIPVCTDPHSQVRPSSAQTEVIVWQDNRSGIWAIYGWRLLAYYTGTEFLISAGTADRLNPAMSEYNCVVWQDRRNGNDDIYAGYLCLSGNDDCGACAIELFESQPYLGSTQGMSPTYWHDQQHYLTSSCGFNDFIDAWHTYRPTIGGPVTITTDGSSLDTILSVFNSCFTAFPYGSDVGNPPIELACNDDYTLFHAGSKVTLNVVRGKTYYIRVSGFNDQTGDYRILVKPGAATEPITSDLNHSGRVDFADFVIFASEWLMSDSTPQ